MRVTGGHILVIGLGRSGRAVVDFLLGLRDGGAPLEIVAMDGDDTEALDTASQAYVDQGVKVVLGADDASGEWDLVVLSPGVPPSSPLFASAKATGAPLVSEIELAYGHSDAAFVAVTGTNGKSTTTLLAAHLLQTAGIRAEAVGNVDPPAVALAPAAAASDVMVCEASSFQLASIRDFHPRVAVLLNVTPDHLDWHGGMERYVSDKARIFENLCESDLAVIVVDDPGATDLAAHAEERGARLCRVSLERLHPGGASVVDGTLTLSAPDGDVALCDASDLLLRGRHNLTNALAAAAVALEMGADPAMIAMGLRSFAPVEHRLEPVGVVGDVEYINDSKATNPDSTAVALAAYADRSLVLLLGGYRSGASFTDLGALLPERARAVVAFGDAADDVVSDIRGAAPVIRASGLSDALAEASQAALPGDVVLLSPACKSFDEFSDYEERGHAFAALVHELGSGGQRA